MAFDPDKYLQGDSVGFDPDAYLAEPSLIDNVTQGVKNFITDQANVGAGMVRGAGSIGATLIRPFESAEENKQRRQQMDEALRTLGADTESGQFALGKFGAEMAGTSGAGGLLSKLLKPAIGAAAPKLLSAIESGGFRLGAPAAETIIGKAGDLGLRAIGGGTAGGLYAGAVDPENAGTGAMIGAALPVVASAATPVLGTLKNIVMPHLSKQAVTQSAARVARDAAGNKLDDVVAALERAKQGQTAGEAAAGAGSAEFEGLQRIARQHSPSEYLDLAARQAELAAAEKQALGVTTASIRNKALESANLKGIESGNVISSIDNQLSEKGIRASDVVQKTLRGIKEKIVSLTNEKGVIDAHDLYTIRKEVGNSIATFSKETSNWDKRLTSGLERKIQGAIDDAIEKAGGRGWKAYLSEYSKGIQDIGSRDVATKAARKMEVAGSSKAREIAGADEIPVSLPNLLSRPMMIINAILRKAQGAGSEKTTAELARLMQNPREMAAVMKVATPSERMEIMKVMAGRGISIAGSQAINGGAE